MSDEDEPIKGAFRRFAPSEQGIFPTLNDIDNSYYTRNSPTRAFARAALELSRQPSPLSSPEHLGALIRDKRKAMGLTQQQFADLTGVGRRFVSELEAGKPTLEFGRVLKVCQSIGLDLIVAAR